MGKDDDNNSSSNNSSRILEEHSYYKMKKTYPMDKCSWSNTGLNQEKLVNGCGNKTVVQEGPQKSFSKDKRVKKMARVEDIITNLKKNKTVITKQPKTTKKESSSFVSMCTIREEHDDIELIELPPLKKLNELEQPEVKRDNKTFFVLQTGEQLHVPSSSTTYLASPQQTTPCSSANQVVYQNVLQRNVPKQDRQQLPLLINKLPPTNLVHNDLRYTNTAVQNSSTRVSNNSPLPQKQLLLITRPGNPIYLTHNFKVHYNEAGNRELHAIPLNNSNDVSRSTSGVTSQSPLRTVQYNLPYPNNACKIVDSPTARYTSQAQLPQTFAQSHNLMCQETMSLSFDSESALIAEIPRASKPTEIPVSFAGNQTAHVTTVPGDPEVLMKRQSSFVPSFVCGTAPEMFARRGELKKRNANDMKVSGMTGLQVKQSAQSTMASTKTNKGIYLKKIKALQKGNNSNIRTNFSRSVSFEKTLAAQAKNAVANIRVSNRKRNQTEKAKMLNKTKRRRITRTKEPLRLRYAKKGKFNENPPIKVKTEPLDGCELTSAVVRPPHTGRSLQRAEHSALKSPTKKRNEVHANGESLSEEVVNSSEEGDDNGNLFRDPALLTREERALQRALLLFKEMEAKQSKKDDPNTMNKSKRNGKINVTQLNRNSEAEALRKRKLVNDGNDIISLAKKPKINTEKSSLQRKAVEILNEPEEKIQQDVEIKPNRKKRRVQLNEHVVEKPTEKVRPGILQKHPVAKKPICIQVPKTSPSATKECKKTKLVKDVTNIPTNLKVSPKVPEKNADSSQEKHRVKTYMLVPSYHGFQDFSPIVLGSRTRNKKAEQVKSDKDDDDITPVKKAEVPKKDIPLLVIETVNNKPVKQDVVVKDEALRDFVKNSLRAQGMLKQDLELVRKTQDEDHFENREKRNVTVNRNTGETVLHKAARMGYDETVYHSIHQGCDSNAKDYAGWTPLHEACSRGHSDVVKVLVKYNADVNSCSNDGIRPIHDAADNGNTDTLRMLIAYGADPLLSTYSGRSCLDCAKTIKAKDYIKACIGDLYLTDERNDVTSVDYENRWEFRGSCSVLDKDAKYMSEIFDRLPNQQPSTSVEFEWSDAPHLPTYNLPLIKDGVVIGRKNYVSLRDLQEKLGKSRNTLVKMLKRTEIRRVPWLEFSKEVSKSFFNKLPVPPEDNSTEEGKVEVVPLNCNVRSLLKIKRENIAL